MRNKIKFFYTPKHVVFFIWVKGQQTEVLRATLPNSVQDLTRLRRIAEVNALELAAALRIAA